MRTARVYIEQTLYADSEIELDERATRYVTQALRLHVGQPLILFDGSGRDYEATLLTGSRRRCRAQLGSAHPPEPPPGLAVHLGLGISRGERMDFAIQKSVELGVAAITPLLTARSAVRLDEARREKRLGHWQGIVISACEQSGRSRLPAIDPPTDLASWLENCRGGLLLHPRAERSMAALPPPGALINLLIGPEGGLDDAEQVLAMAKGYEAVRLGPRVLRTETAPIAALAAIQVLWGDLR